MQQVLLMTLERVRAGKLRQPETLASFVLGMCRMVVLEARRGTARREGLLHLYGDVPEAVDPPEQTEIDEAKRNAAMREAQRIHYDDIGHIPLHQQVIPWAMRSNVTVFHRADNRLDMRWARID